ncbi:hypothetical protein [Dactylosporangium sp. CA-233914]|uniref:hypothetical protein n=1 Tax=Dactylosporangium sp. CA-233914 TaxID=3239934 RepID=UPI003D8B2A80
MNSGIGSSSPVRVSSTSMWSSFSETAAGRRVRRGASRNVDHTLTRRTVLTTAGAALAAGGMPLPGPSAAGNVRAVSMAMHIHGPFSEGLASFSAHLEQAREHGVDVIWWTDHDFRIAAFEHRRAVHFDGVSEPEHGLDWKWSKQVEGKVTGAVTAFVAAPHSPQDGTGKALRLASKGKGVLWYAGQAWNQTANACIADTQLTLDVLPETLPADGSLLFELQLSNQPGKGVLRMRYQIGPFPAVTHTADGTTGTVRLPVKPAQWQQFTFVPRDDVARLWPDVVADDNALTGLRIGVRNAGFVVDRLTFRRSRRAGQAGEQLRAEVIAAAAAGHGAGVTHYRAMEVSLVRHLNWFGGDQTFPSFPSPPIRDDDPALTASMVRYLKSHGGLVSWNHPMDVAKKDELAKLMIERDFLGVDIVEIGRKPYDELLWVFDVAARNALFFTAVGSSDDHDATNWAKESEHAVTYVWAASRSQADLLAALAKGAAWFTDLARYRGTLDLRIGGVSFMGAVLMTKTPAKVDVVATGVPAGARVEVLVGAADEAAAVPSAKVAKSRTVTVPPGHYVRAQVRLAGGDVVGVSNPLWVLDKAPRRPIPAVRLRNGQ